ncbi:MAG: hypothetical protein AAF607_05215 [Pseudomonadota bacterium]
MKHRIFMAAYLTCLAVPLPSLASTFSLIGTELKLNARNQATPISPIISFEATVSAIVSASAVEYPNVNDFGFTNTTIPGFPVPQTTVPVAIDAGADFLTIDFSNAGSGSFSQAFQNSYIFTFADTVSPLLTGAEIDTSVTTLGLLPDDVTFENNQLFVNVESLPFTSSTFARINLTAQPGTAVIPIPATLPLMASSMIAFGVLRWRRSGQGGKPPHSG